MVSTRPERPLPGDDVGRARPVITGIRPCIDGGRRPGKATVGEPVPVSADVFTDGHDHLLVEVRFRPVGGDTWQRRPLVPVGNDRWEGELPVESTGRHEFALWATIDHYGTWLHGLQAKAAAGQDVALELRAGAELLGQAAKRAGEAGSTDADTLLQAAQRAETAAAGDVADGVVVVADAAVVRAARRHPDPTPGAVSDTLALLAERARARFSSWYELFPRSASPDPERPGTLADVVRRLDYVARLGFDVLYLPPIHPIGTTHRKGPDGAPVAGPGDPGSPWAIGSAEGGHTAVHPELGTVDDVERLVDAAAGRGIEVALDLAYQCSPDHPWVHQHPDWFRHLPDGSIRPAENPPKRYEDVYPLDFACDDWRGLWRALADVVDFWVGHGIGIFRVDNPHTKPLRFWEWLIDDVHRRHPDVLFLAEAFTRPRVMEHLAKIGFSQSYTYFTWRNTKWELESYLTELTGTDLADYFRPNFWPNTPDILHETLQYGGRGAFLARLVLAATLSASYGIYGPAFELQEHEPRQAGSEEYRNSEKYVVRHWDLERPDSLAEVIGRVNAVRHGHRALQQNRSLRFHPTDNDQLIAYSKRWPAVGPAQDVVLCVVNLDPHHRQSGWVHLDLRTLGLAVEGEVEVHDLLTDARYRWGWDNFAALDPDVVPAHVFHVTPPPASATGA